MKRSKRPFARSVTRFVRTDLQPCVVDSISGNASAGPARPHPASSSANQHFYAARPLMRKSSISTNAIVTIAIVLLATGFLQGASGANDNANNATYLPGWLDGTNGGIGWGSPWYFSKTTLGTASFFTDSSISNGGGSIDGGGHSWAMYGQPNIQGLGGYAYAYRNMSSTLSIGQHVDLDISFPSPTAAAGRLYFGQTDAFRQTSFSNVLAFAPSINNYFLGSTGDVGQDLGISTSNQALHLSLTIVRSTPADTAYTLAVTPIGPGGAAPTKTFGGTYSGPTRINTLVFEHSGLYPPYPNDPTKGSMFLNNLTVSAPAPVQKIVLDFDHSAQFAVIPRKWFGKTSY